MMPKMASSRVAADVSAYRLPVSMSGRIGNCRCSNASLIFSGDSVIRRADRS